MNEFKWAVNGIGISFLVVAVLISLVVKNHDLTNWLLALTAFYFVLQIIVTYFGVKAKRLELSSLYDLLGSLAVAGVAVTWSTIWKSSNVGQGSLLAEHWPIILIALTSVVLFVSFLEVDKRKRAKMLMHDTDAQIRISAMWLRFLTSGWYEILVGTLLVIALGLAFYVYGPQLGTGIDGLLAWIGGLPIEGRVLTVFFLGLGVIWLGVASMNTLLRIER